MRTFAKKQNQTGPLRSHRSRPLRLHFAAHGDVHQILPLQRTIGNRGLMRLLKTGGLKLAAGLHVATISPQRKHGSPSSEPTHTVPRAVNIGISPSDAVVFAR
jgi:hypothetical protein